MTPEPTGEPVGSSPTIRRVLAPNPGMMTGPGTNTYLVGTSEVAVVDPGPDIADHVQAITAAGGGRIRWVIVTHTHPDHAPAAAALAAATGAERLGFGSRDGFEPDREIGEGFVLDTGSARLRAVHTPGHASNHLCYLHEEEGVLFSGDHVMDGSTVVVTPPDGDMAQYMESLQRLRDGEISITAIAPGHGNLITDPHARLDEYIVHRMAREMAIARALEAAGNASIAQIVAAVYTDVPEFLHVVAEFSVWAHLRKLAVDGKCRAENRDDRASVWTWSGA